MRATNTIRNFILAAFTLLLFSTVAAAQTTVFTYQGHLKNGGTPANGSYDFEFALFDDLSAGSQLDVTRVVSAVPVANGIFSVRLDFVNNFPGANRFLEIRVRQTGGGSFTLLTPRQSVSSVPYAIQSLNATNAINATMAVTATNATQLNGQGPSFYQNAANLNSGSLADARLSSNVATLAGTQTFSGAKTFSAASVFNSTVGIGTPSPQRALSIAGGLVVDQGNQNTTTNAFGISFGSFSGEGIASNRGAGANQNGLDFFAGAGPGPRMSLTNSGNLGIGTTTPGAPLEVQVATGQSFQFRQDSGVPGLNVNTTGGNAGIMRLRNTVEVWPSDDATRAGKVDVRNTSGNPTISLDGQTGNISAANYPRAKVVQTYRDVRNGSAAVSVGVQQSPNIDSITVNIPASGVLILRATIQLFVQTTETDPAQNAFFKLSDTTGSPVTLCETNYGFDTEGISGVSVTSTFDTLTVEWGVNVNAGTRTYSTSLFNDGSHPIFYYSTSLQAIFIPAGL